MDGAIKNYEKSISDSLRTQRAMNNEWKVTHPNLSQLSLGLGKVSSAAFRLKSIYDTVNLAFIRQNTGQIKEAQLVNEKAIVIRELADLQSAPDYVAGSKKELELKQKIAELDAEIKASGSSQFGQMLDTVIQVGITVPLALSGIKSMVEAANALSKVNVAAGWATLTGTIRTAASAMKAFAVSSTFAAMIPHLGVLAGGALGSYIGLEIKARQNNRTIYEELEANTQEYQNVFGSLFPDVQQSAAAAADNFDNAAKESEKVGFSSHASGISWGKVESVSAAALLAASQAGMNITLTGQSIHDALTNAWNTLIRWVDEVARMTVQSAEAASSGRSGGSRRVVRVGPAIGGGSGVSPGLGGRAGLVAQRANASGGAINEYVFGIGASGRTYSFGEMGPEMVTPMTGGRGGGNVTNHYNINIHVAGSVVTEDKLAESISRAMVVTYNRIIQ